MAPVGPADYNFTLRNDVQVSDRILEFDLYLQDLDATEPFEIATAQAGITVNTAGILNGGVITCAVVAGSTAEMVAGQRITTVLWVASQNVIKITPKTPPGWGGGTVISSTAPGTKFARIRITNTLAFTANSTANLAFCFTTVPYPTKIFRYQNADEASPGTNTQMANDVTNTYSLLTNIVLNAAVTCNNPTAYNVTGGGSFCEGGSSTYHVLLSNSEADVSYQLYDGAATVGTPVTGTGAGLDFGVQPVGSYTVVGTRVCTPGPNKSTTMTGTAVITMNLLPAAPSFTQTDPTCASAFGSITVTAPLGLTYSIGGAYQAEVLFAGLVAGPYTITAKSVAGCVSAGTPATIAAQPLPPATPTFTQTDPTCASAFGSITVTAPLGLTYSIGGAYQAEVLFANVAAGPYTLTAKSVAGCISGGASVTIAAQPLPPAQVTVSATQPTCISGVGSITVTSPLGLTYSIGGAYQSAVLFASLAPGDYNVTAKSVAGCISDPLLVTINAQPSTPAQPTITPLGATTFCSGGSVDLQSSVATSYLWSTGAITRTITVSTAGFYSVVVSNGTCSSVASALTEVVVTTPVTPTFAQLGPYVQGSVPGTLPGTSINSINGTWNPATISTATVGFATYNFTPTAGQCANTASMSIEVTAIPVPVASLWNGSQSNNDFFDVLNWTNTPSVVAYPGATTAVTIPGGKSFYPTLTTAGTQIASMHIQDGGSFIGAENLVIPALAAIIDRNISDTHAHLVSSPVFSTTWSDVYAAGDMSKIWVRVWNPLTNAWVNQAASDVPVAGKGYAESNTLTSFPLASVFMGTMNKVNVVSPAMSTANGAWNLLGNPFQSAIDWDNVLAFNPGVVGNAVWVWDAAAGNYINWNGSIGGLTGGIIPAENGFFVSATSDGASVTIPLSARVHGHAGLYKDAVSNVLSLQANGNGGSDQMFVHFNDNASATYDNQFDARKLAGEAYAPQLYSMITNDVLAINELPLAGNEVVNVGFSCNTNGEYSFTAAGMESFDASTPILLEDMNLNTTQNLRENAVYNFSYAAGENANRFKLHFKSTTGINGIANSGISVYSYNRNVVINNTTSLAGEVWVYDMTGRELNHSSITSQMTTSIPMQAAVGAYMVKVVTAKASVNQKVFIR